MTPDKGRHEGREDFARRADDLEMLVPMAEKIKDNANLV